jgi:hypothetical protein
MSDEIARLSCEAVSRIVAERAKIDPPHRDTIRAWGLRWCVQGVHYVATPGRFFFRPCGVEKILAELAEAR